MTKISFFWIAEYDNGKILPQFDFKTGKENLFKILKLDKIIKFGLYPFTKELKSKVPEAIFNPILPHYIINLEPEDKLIFRRRGYVQISNRTQKQYKEYIIGTQDYLIVIDESGNIEVRKELD